MRSQLTGERRIEIALFLVSFLTFAYFYQASDHSTAARFDVIRSMLERHSVWIEGYAGYNTADIIFLKSHIFSAKAPGGSLTGVVPWVASVGLLTLFPPHSEALLWALLTYLTIVFSTSLLVAIGVVLTFRIARLFDATLGRAVAVALTMAFGTITFVYATEMTGEPMAGVCGLASFYILLRWVPGKNTGGRALAAGFLAGWAVLCDYPAAIIAIPLAFYALRQMPSWRERLFFGCGAGITIITLLTYNEAAFGNPFFLSYQAYSMPGQNFPEQAKGFVGLTYPKPFILWNILIAPQRGLFFCNPVLLMMFPGFAYFWRRRDLRAEFWVVIIVAAGFILFNGSYGESIVSWGGGTATGPRQIAAAIPFMVLSLVFLPASLNYLFGAAALLSTFLMLVATSVEPHFPYEYYNPLKDFALPAYFRGDLAYNKLSYFGGDAVAGDSVAFNLGKLFGLPRAVQLWPLAILWIAAARFFLKELGSWRGVGQQRLAIAAAAIIVASLFLPPTVGALLPPKGINAKHGLVGRYYEGVQAPNSFGPHLVRIDPQINFDNIAQLGALPFPSATIWTGWILIEKPGMYRFDLAVDDNGWLTIDGTRVIGDPGMRGLSHQVGYAFLTAGEHRILLGQRNLLGDESIHFYWQPPGAPIELVPSRVLSPRLLASDTKEPAIGR